MKGPLKSADDIFEKRKDLIKEREAFCNSTLSQFKYQVSSLSKTVQTNDIHLISSQQNLNLPKKIRPYIVKLIKSQKGKVEPHESQLFQYNKNPDTMTFQDYLQFQNEAFSKFKPGRGQTNEILENIKTSLILRKKIIERETLPILKPKEEDSIDQSWKTVTLKDPLLTRHTWKNYFTLGEYQKILLDNVRGKICRPLFRGLQQRFKLIAKMNNCKWGVPLKIKDLNILVPGNI